MIKWFFIYKWLELKEFVKQNWLPVVMVGGFILSSIICGIMLSKVESMRIIDFIFGGIIIGVVCAVVLAFITSAIIKINKITKDNIQKAKNAASYIASELECYSCGGDIKIKPPRLSCHSPRYKCLKCGFESSVECANRRQDGNNK